MRSFSVQNQMESLSALVQRLLAEHRDFSSKSQALDHSISKSEFASVSDIILSLRESLIDHMLVEETEIFPEVSRRGFFNERISEIMQQHVEITAALDRIRFALHRKNIQELKVVFDELAQLMNTHFPAEEEEVFPLVT